MAYFKLEGAVRSASWAEPGTLPFPRGAAGGWSLFPPWARGHVSWGEDTGVGGGLFQGHLEEGLHDYTVGEPRAGSGRLLCPSSLPRWCWRRV